VTRNVVVADASDGAFAWCTLRLRGRISVIGGEEVMKVHVYNNSLPPPAYFSFLSTFSPFLSFFLPLLLLLFFKTRPMTRSSWS
jgi:hypothetical protein